MPELQPQNPGPEPRKDPSSGSLSAHARQQDLRRYLRFRIDDASAKLYIKGFLTSLGLGRVNKARAAINMSEGGVMLLARDMIPVGTKVTIRIEMEKFKDFIETTGVVRWCSQGARSDKDYYAGIQFSGLDPAEIKKIAQMRDWFNSPEYRTRTATRRRAVTPPNEPHS